jgi:chorismate mutase/prephenate dehydratase
MNNLGKHRKAIDYLDKKIVTLLQARAEQVKKISDEKNKSGSEVYDPAREAEVLKRVKNIKKGKFSPDAIGSIYNEIFSASRMLQRRISVAYMGPAASYTHLAAIKRFGKSTDYMPVAGVKEVFLEVEKGTVDYGCVPIENSTEGAVNYTYDLFADSDLKIYSELELEIKHCLMSKQKDIADIRIIYSHPQSLAQCRGWIEANVPHAVLKEVSSNSKAAVLAAGDKTAGAVAGELAAELNGLNVLASSIQDVPDNVTRFFIIGKGQSGKTGDDKTSIMVSIKDKVGALYHLLKPFEKYKVNLTNIESRPSKKKAWDYYFFVDFMGHKDEPKIKKALAEIERECGGVKVLGSYPRF